MSVRIEVTLTEREADELLRCELRRFTEGYYWPDRQTVAQKTALFKLVCAVHAARSAATRG